MGSRPANPLKTENFDMDTFFDFNQGNPSPVNASSSRNDAMSPLDQEERQQFNGPSHDYGQFKQQVGLPVDSMANMPLAGNGMFDSFNSGANDMGFNAGFGWNSGIDLDGDMGMDMSGSQTNAQPMFFPSADRKTNNFVNPNSVGGHEEPQSNVGRLWPGMHSQQAQQAALQKAAQAQAVQQRHMKLQAQHAPVRQVPRAQSQSSQGSSQHSQGHGKRASHVTEPHVEESISRLLNQMRQNSAMQSDDADSPSGSMPHIARLKKDDEEMDDDERLLASEEGKKLSSKERRQLRNKVSARAFRSRRKEYISQLEGEVAVKVQEANTLRQEKQALMHENDRYRGLIETLLRHPAFTPFINDISKDPSVLMPPPPQQQVQQQQPNPSSQPTQVPSQPPPQQTPSQQEMKPDFMSFDASQVQVPQQSQVDQPQQQQQQIGLAMVPENDFSKLNLNGFNSLNFNFNSVNAYAMIDTPVGPDPVDLLTEFPARLPLSTATTAATSTASDSYLTVLLAKLDRAARSLSDVAI